MRVSKVWDSYRLEAYSDAASHGYTALLQGQQARFVVIPRGSEVFEVRFATPCCGFELIGSFTQDHPCEECRMSRLGTLGPYEWREDLGSLQESVKDHLAAWVTDPLTSEIVAEEVVAHLRLASQALTTCLRKGSSDLDSVYQSLVAAQAHE